MRRRLHREVVRRDHGVRLGDRGDGLAGGDESLATAATFTYRGATQTLRTQTFRFGDTIANYFTLNTTAFVQGGLGNGVIPTALVKAQNAKLG